MLKGRFTATPTEEEPVTYLVHITLASGLELYHTALDLPQPGVGVMIERRIRIPLQKGARYGMIQKPTKKQKGEREN